MAVSVESVIPEVGQSTINSWPTRCASVIRAKTPAAVVGGGGGGFEDECVGADVELCESGADDGPLECVESESVDDGLPEVLLEQAAVALSTMSSTTLETR